MKVEIKPELTVLVHKTVTTLSNLSDHMDVTQQLFADAVNNNMKICGCNFWIYNGCDGDFNKSFELQIALPVLPTKNAESSFDVVKLQPFKCVTGVHLGPWQESGKTYCELMAEIAKLGHTPGKFIREIYLNCDFTNPQNNITEIQIEIL